jgi:hypothetical protein
MSYTEYFHNKVKEIRDEAKETKVQHPTTSDFPSRDKTLRSPD